MDFAARRNSLEQPATPDQLLQSWHDGRIKQLVISRTLQAVDVFRGCSPRAVICRFR